MLLETVRGVLVWSDAVYVNITGKIHIIHYSKLLQKVQVSLNPEIILSLCINTVFPSLVFYYREVCKWRSISIILFIEKEVEKQTLRKIISV